MNPEQELLDRLLATEGVSREDREAALREIMKRGALASARAIASNSITISCTAQVIEHNFKQLFVPKEQRTFGM